VSAPSVSTLTPAIVFLVLIVAILARRAYLMVHGARYAPARLFGFSGFYTLLYALVAFPTLFAAVSAWGTVAYLLLVPYLAVPLAAAGFSAPYVRRIVRFERREGGAWYYQVPWLIPVLYLGLFVLRFALEILLFGPSVISSFFQPTSVPTGLILLLVGVDLLLGASTGFLIGRSIGVYRAGQDLPGAAVHEGAAPLPHAGSP